MFNHYYDVLQSVTDKLVVIMLEEYFLMHIQYIDKH